MFDACIEFSTSHRHHQWLCSLFTVGKKWVLYINYERRRQWMNTGEADVATPKIDLHPKKVMLSV